MTDSTSTPLPPLNSREEGGALPSEALRRLAEAHGVATAFHDWRGEERPVSAETLRAVLGALGVAAGDEAEVEAALGDVDNAPWREVLPPTTLQVAGDAPWISVHVPHGAPVTVMAMLENGDSRPLEQLDVWVDPREVDGSLVGRATFLVPADLPLGWHRLEARVGTVGEVEPGDDTSDVATATLITVPHRIESPAANDPTRRMGTMTQLYQLRSEGSWGIGDLTDTATLAEWSARHGADFLLINPVHAQAPTIPVEPSPYLPTSRRFRDPLLIRPERIPGYADLSADERSRVDAWGNAARRGNRNDRIDRNAAWEAKLTAFGILCPVDLSRPERRRAFGEFCEREGQPLVDFATWSALALTYGTDWRGWPAALQHPEDPAVAAFRDAHADTVEHFRWMQWVVEEQLEALQDAATNAGMAIGIVHDLAVGVHPTGADRWSMQGVLASGVTVGAPPDMFNQLGQNWSQPPWRPDALARAGYAPFRDMVRAALRGAGALRIDHILGLFRLWWIPEGKTPDQGTYMRYDSRTLLGILALEATRANAIVIGEDMGVVPEETVAALADRRIDGTGVLWFERGGDDEPLSGDAYRFGSLTSVTTHDLPPTLGYLRLAHVDLRDRLGLLTVPAEEERAHERDIIERFRRRLATDGLLAPDNAEERSMVLALHEFLARSNARLTGVSVADLVQDVRSINQPGTDQRLYPNWCLPLADADGRVVLLEELCGDGDPQLAAAAAELLRASRR